MIIMEATRLSSRKVAEKLGKTVKGELFLNYRGTDMKHFLYSRGLRPLA